MAKVIEFYISEHFRKPHEWSSQLQLEKVLESGSRTNASAYLWLKLSLAYEKGVLETLHSVDLDHVRC
jgi:hypothetical protein